MVINVMNPEQLKVEISQLVIEDQLALVEVVWDNIAAANAGLPMPDPD